jgi:hypothetical protein
MQFGQGNQPIEALTTDGADDSFAISIVTLADIVWVWRALKAYRIRKLISVTR